MPVKQWTQENVAALSDDDLIGLRNNAERNLNHAKLADLSRQLLAWCQEEIEKRGLLRKNTKTGSRSRSADPLKIREDELASEMGEFARLLTEKFDLTPETAMVNSKGCKGFKPHGLTSTNGKAKLGGLQKSGKCAIDRYISYRVANSIVSLNIYLPKGSVDPEEIQFLVFAPRTLLPDGVTASEIVLEASEEKSPFYDTAKKLASLDEAKEVFVGVLSKVAAAR